MKKYLIIFVVFTVNLVSCSQKKTEKVKSEKISYPMQSVMINKTQCNLYGEFREIQVESIVGSWTDSLFWKMQPNKPCYFGINQLDVDVELIINPNKTFRLSTNYSKPEHNRVEMGEYFLFYDSTKTTLTLATNPNGEELFEHGDTMRNSVVYELRWIDNKTMILDAEIEIRGFRLREAIEFKKSDS
jgi:hypothetical protein